MKITFCTPTFNRATLLPDLYNSLLKQKCYDFEWLIVDDGSSDSTKMLINDWSKRDNGFPIRYIFKKNGGKHTAINIGIKSARGDYFCIVDSDDYLKNDASSMIIESFEGVPEDYAGIGFNKIFEDDHLVGKTFKGNYLDATSLEREKHHIIGDKAEVFRSNILKNYEFPVFENERFITETVVWYRIANDGHKIRWFNKAFYVCRYQPNGLSMSNTSLLNPIGYTLSIKELASYKTSFRTKAKPIGVYCYCFHKNGFKYKQISKMIRYPLFYVALLGSAYGFKKKLISRNSRAKKFHVKESGK